jgi:hypothetical protein
VKTYFISGHLDLTVEEFEAHYAPAIRDAFWEGYPFVVGDAPGADTLAQTFLKGLGADVTVYHMLESPRNNQGFITVGGFKGDRTRDEAMTAASDADIAWVRPGREKSGTARNLARRQR